MTQADEWTKLVTLPTRYEADLLGGRLQEAGIPTRASKASNDPSGWLKAYGNSLGKFDLFVPAGHTSEAQELLDELHSAIEPSPDRTRRSVIEVVGRRLLLASLFAIAAALLWDVVR